jgi:hypothetical protein
MPAPAVAIAEAQHPRKVTDWEKSDLSYFLKYLRFSVLDFEKTS